MSNKDSDAEKTEAPTPHRLEKARKEGQIPRSKELTSALLLLTGWALMWQGGDHMARNLARLMQHGLTFDQEILQDPGSMLRRMYVICVVGAKALLPFAGGLFVVAISAPTLLGGLSLSGKSLKPNVKRLSPLAGFKRIYSAQLFSELLKSVLKVLLVATVSYGYLRANWTHLIQLAQENTTSAMQDGLLLILTGCLLAALSIIPMVAWDVFFQLTSHIKKLRMTRQEVRDELKEQEGNPQIKAKIRQMQRAAAQRRMMSDIPKADVIVNNPTHYSVAIQYREGDMTAPVVLAKGRGETALRIREAAAKYQIPVLEAPPLARALYRHCDIGAQIPTTLYSAVAEVLAWVYGLKRWRSGSGVRPPEPKNLPVPAALDFQHKSQTDV